MGTCYSVLVAEARADKLRPIRRDEYDKIVALGIFDGERVELLYGNIVPMSPHGAPHDGAIQRLNHLLMRAVGDRAAVRIQSSFAALDDSQPEPDVAIVPPGDYDDAHPREAYLIVEVAHSSLEVDRGKKARLYAESGVPEYWVVNLVDGLIEVHTDIVRGAYARIAPYRKGQTIALERLAGVAVAVSDVLR